MKGATKTEEFWRKNINKLKAFYRQYKHYNIPGDWKQDQLFAQWVENIRKYPNRLSAKAYAELKRIGFDFNIPTDWEAMYQKLKKYYQQHGHSYVPPNNRDEKLFDWTINQKHARPFLTSSQVNKLEKLQFNWELITQDRIGWEVHYQELIKFKRKFGHTRVPQGYKENSKLARWVSSQRKFKTANKLSSDKIRSLTRIGFLWKEDILRMRNEAWEKQYKELVRYKKLHGNIDRLAVLHENYSLGLWVETQLKNRRNMSPERRKKLDAIGFDWNKRNARKERWDIMFQRLKDYRKANGHCLVKRSEDFQLSVWLSRHKRDHKILDPVIRKKLEKLGVKWAGQIFQERWHNMYSQLKKFKKENGHMQVPRKLNRKLFEWMQDQKKLKNEKRLPKKREEKLIKLGFIWSGEIEKQKITQWEKMFRKFKALKEKHPTKFYTKLMRDADLHHWVIRQLHNKNKLSAFKKEKLNSIGFSWKLRRGYWDELWEDKYVELLAFKKKYGHCDVPQNYPPSPSLGHWVNTQRIKRKNLSEDKIDKLNKIGFSWENEIKERRWQQRIDEYIHLKRKNKHLTIPVHSSLYSWLYNQMRNYKRLSSEKKRILLKARIIHLDGKRPYIVLR